MWDMSIIHHAQYRHFPWRVIMRDGCVDVGVSRDDAIAQAIRLAKYSFWGKHSKIKVYDRFNHLDFTITRVK